MAKFTPLVITVGLLIAIVVNVLAKTSHFLQLLDLMQLVAACLYLEIQYPIMLEKFLSQLSPTLFTFMPNLIQQLPYSFSSPKWIFYNIDTSLTRTHLLTFIIFILLFTIMITTIIVNRYFTPLPRMVNRIKYRNLNDLFSIFSFPLLLFSFAFFYAKPIDIALGVVVILLTLSWIVFISNLIIQAE